MIQASHLTPPPRAWAGSRVRGLGESRADSGCFEIMARRSLGAVHGPPLLRPTLAGVECGVSARSKPALDWNVACACVLSPLVTPGGDVDGSRPRPRAPGTLPLGTARSGPSSLPRAQAEAGPGRGRSRAGWGPGSGHLPGRAFALEGGAELTCRFLPQPPVSVPGKPSESQSDRSFRAHIPTDLKTFSPGPPGNIPGHIVE